MLLKNLTYAFRNLWRDKFYALLNGIGLTIGMTVALLIFMWIKSEVSYDNYHSNGDQIHVVLGNTFFGGKRTPGPRTPAPLAKAAKAQIPEIQHMARAMQLWQPVLKHESFLINAKNTHLIDPSLLEILDFEFIQGDPKKSLNTPNSIILTEGIAHKIFGDENPMGKTLTLEDTLNLQVTAIIKNTPTNTHMQVDCLVPLEGNAKYFMNEHSMNWGSFNFTSYVLLRPDTSPEKIGKQLTDLQPNRANEEGNKRSFFTLHPVKDIYLDLEEVKHGFAKGDWAYIRLFGFIGFLILLIASINYINLTTARVAHRAKATGIRKIIGASRSQLIIQHITEAFCLISVCTFSSILLAQLCLPYFEIISGKTFTHPTVFTGTTFLLAGSIALITVLLSGIQPALQLSSFRPVEALRGSGFKGIAGKSGLRKVLVVTQFVSSTALIICTFFMLRQMDFIQNSKLGYQKEHTFTFRHTAKDPRILRDALKGQPGIENVTMSDQSIVYISNRLGNFTWEGMEEKVDLPIFQINTGYQFKDFFGLELLDGRWFNPGGNDENSYIINEAAAKALQLDQPVGKWIDFWGERGIIVGVMKDFHFQSLRNDIKQLIFRQNGTWFPTMSVKTTGDQAAQAIASAEKIFKSQHPNDVFEYEFLDETYNNLYKTESKISSLFLLFALVAILISCLGIFGLATYSTEKRFKEIGIRKVLGATVWSIIQLLSKDFLKLVLLALIIAIPIAWYFMNNWLGGFVYRIQMEWWVFGIAGALAIGIAFITVGLQSLKAALTNPVESIKTE